MNHDSKKHHLCLILRDQQAVSLERGLTGAWTVRRVKGEELIPLKPGKSPSLRALLSELSAQYNHADQLAEVQVDILYSDDSLDHLKDLPAELARQHCRAWQILRLEPLIESLARHSPPPERWSLAELRKAQSASAQWLLNSLMPHLDALLDGECLQAEPAAAPARPARTTGRSVPVAQAAHSTAHPPASPHRPPVRPAAPAYPDDLDYSDEQLLSFLPALYKGAFNVLDGAKLAELTGRDEPYRLPRPYNELNEHARNTKQREFVRLPPKLQRRIVGFVRAAGHKLAPHPEMQATIRRLEDA